MEPGDCFGSQVTLSWSDPAGDQAGFIIERSTDGVNFTQVGSTAASVMTYVDQGLQGSTQYWYTVYATNTSGSSDASNVAEITTVTTPEPAITSPAQASGTVGGVFSYQITASENPSSFTVSGNLPTGVSLDPSSGLISGTPLEAGDYVVSIGAANNAAAGNGTLTIDISSPQSNTSSGASNTPAGGSVASTGGTAATTPSAPSVPPASGSGLIPVLSSPASASGELGQNFNYSIISSASPNAYSLTGTLPSGLSFNSSLGTISGLPAAAGTFTVTIGASNIFGGAQGTLTIAIAGAAPAQALVNAASPESVSRLVNLSARAVCGNGDQSLVVGFVVSGGATQVLTRGIGPTLSAFGLADALVDPQLTLYAGLTSLGSNSGWGGTSALAAAFTQAGAFSLPTGSHDAALLSNLTPGSYSAQVSNPTGSPGVALGEVYDEDTSSAPAGKLSNFSARAQVGTNSNALVAGFVIEGNSPKQVLIRAVGPGLTQFGVTGVLAQPQIDLYQGASVIQHNSGWGGDQALAAAFSQVGAFALTSPLDSAMLVTLNPGAYTAEVSGSDGGSGVALVEIYDML